jgi:predicted solute-binding protein
MITETIIVALITSAFTFAGVLVANWSNRKKTDVDQAQRDQRIQDKISELTKKVEEHNGMLDRVANIEKSIVRIETKLEKK